MKDQRESRFFRYAFLALLGLMFVLHFFVPVTYAVNDDTTMRSIASGAMTGVPDGHLIFVKYSLGAVIAFLYRCVPDVDWYGFTMLAIIAVSMLLLLYRAEKLFKAHIAFGLVSVLSIFTITIFENFVNFQFTVVSAVAAAAAIFFYNTIDPKKACYQWEYVPVLLLAWISCCVRLETFVMALPFAGLSFLFKEGKWKEKLVVCGALLAGIAAIMLTEHAAYSSEEWQAYLQYNEDRSAVYDYYGVPDYEEHAQFYASIDMMAGDVKNLEEYNLYMIDGIEDGKMKAIAEYARDVQAEKAPLEKLKECVSLLIDGCLKNRSILLNLLSKLVILASLWFEFRRKKKTFWLNLGFLAVEAGLLAYMGFQGRILTRVMTALLLIEFFTALSIWCREHQDLMDEVLSARVSRAVLAGMLGLSAFMIYEVRDNQMMRYERNLEWEELQEYYQQDPENVYFTNTDYIWFYTDNFHLYKRFQTKNYEKLGEWSTFSPLENAELARLGIQNVSDALVENENVYLIYKEADHAITGHYRKQGRAIEWSVKDQAPIAGEMVPVYKLLGENDD